MSYVKQIVKGRTVRTLDVVASADDLTALTDLMDGQVDVYDEKSSGGTDIATPAELNRKRFSCGDKSQNLSCSFTVPHVKAGANKSDFKAVVVGKFDANYDSTTKSTYMNLLYDRN